MSNNDKKTGTGRSIALLVLFFVAVALIAVGLWKIFRPLGLIFCGVVLLYMGTCIAGDAGDR